jgi:hypothetical protein
MTWSSMEMVMYIDLGSCIIAMVTLSLIHYSDVKLEKTKEEPYLNRLRAGFQVENIFVDPQFLKKYPSLVYLQLLMGYSHFVSGFIVQLLPPVFQLEFNNSSCSALQMHRPWGSFPLSLGLELSSEGSLSLSMGLRKTQF